MPDNRQFVLNLPTIAGKIPPGARIQADFDCPDCGAHYTREVEPIPQIISVDCPCGIKVQLELRRPATPPNPLAQALQPWGSSKFADPGYRAKRNAPCPCGSGKKFKHCCRRKP